MRVWCKAFVLFFFRGVLFMLPIDTLLYETRLRVTVITDRSIAHTTSCAVWRPHLQSGPTIFSDGKRA
jgi:hypothetical protein